MSRGLAVTLLLVSMAGALWVSGVSSCRGPSRSVPEARGADRDVASNRGVSRRGDSARRSPPRGQEKDGAPPLPDAGGRPPAAPEWTLDDALAVAKKLSKTDVMASFSPHGGGQDVDVDSIGYRWMWWVKDHGGKLTDVEIERVALAYGGASLTESAALTSLLASATSERDQAEWTRRGGKGRLSKEGWSPVVLSSTAQAELLKTLREWGTWTDSEYDWEDRDYFDYWDDFVRGIAKESVTELLARSGYSPVAEWLTEHPERMRKWNLGGSLVVPALIQSARYNMDAARRAMARTVLAAMRDPAAAPLLWPLLRDDDHDLRLAALNGLTREQEALPTADVILLLQEAQSDKERAAAIKSLGESGNAAVGPMLLDTAKERVARLRKKSPKDPLQDDRVLWESCEALAKLRDPGAIDWWMGAILQPGSTAFSSDSESGDLCSAIDWLGIAHAEKAKPMLDAILQNSAETEGRRRSAREALQRITNDFNYGLGMNLSGGK